MIIKMWRIINKKKDGDAEDFVEHKWYGIAAAQNMKDLFWQIDEHLDPWAVEIASIPKAGLGICWKETEVDLSKGLKPEEIDMAALECDEYLELQRSDFELSDLLFGIDDDLKWSVPDWGKYNVYG